MSPLGRCLLVISLVASAASAAPVAVTVAEKSAGQFTLQREGKPYLICGAGGTSHLAELAALGGNSIRTWGIEELDKTVDGKPLLDRCHELGITVAAGIWIGHERHGFNYSDSAQLDRQRDAVRAAVTKHRDHPALLLWGLGNEMEGPESDGQDPRIWKELEVLAGIVKQADPHHPVMTVIAGAGESKIKGILEHYPSLDILGINAYAGAGGAVAAARRVGWKKPVVLAEFGPHGHWEVAKTTWGAPIEPSGREKAASYSATMAQLGKHRDVCLGSYVFLWGQKQEVTATWYGMFLSTGEKLPVVDATSHGWTGKWPANRAPVIVSIDTALRETRVAAGKSISAKAVAEDADADPLTWQWMVVRESTDRKAGGDAESAPPAVAGAVTPADGPAAVIVTPREAGAYRLFVTVRDGRGGACTDNIPFFVEP